MARYADMFTALGSESHLRVLSLLLFAHSSGLVVGEIQRDLGVSPATSSRHLERLKQEGWVNVKRESTFLRYAANTAVLQELLTFLVSERCSRSSAVCPDVVMDSCQASNWCPSSKTDRLGAQVSAWSHPPLEGSIGRYFQLHRLFGDACFRASL